MSDAKTSDVEVGPRWEYVSNLLLDGENPRLIPEAVSYSQTKLCLLLEKEFELFPIARSMVDNGYFQEEPMIGIIGSNKTIIIVEGNRRLAALKFLTDAGLRKVSVYRDEWEELCIRSQKTGHDLSKIPVVVHKNRSELTAVLGFRHITGILPWEPLAKARFINGLIEDKKVKNFYEISEEVGSRQDTIRNNYVAYRVYMQAKDFDIDISEVEKKFGVFYTALNNSDIREYIGLDFDKSLAELRNPIPKRKDDELRKLVEFLHGTSKVKRVLTDSRQISKLGEILASPEARKILEATREFDLAYRSTGGEERTLIENLTSASIHLTEAYKTVYLHCHNPNVRHLVDHCARIMDQILKSCTKTG